MKMIWAVIRPDYLKAVEAALLEAGFKGITAQKVKGYGEEQAYLEAHLYPHVKLEILVLDEEVEKVLEIITNKTCTGVPGDGIIGVLPVEETLKIRTKERGKKALV